jgi:hypothetical protein
MVIRDSAVDMVSKKISPLEKSYIIEAEVTQADSNVFGQVSSCHITVTLSGWLAVLHLQLERVNDIYDGRFPHGLTVQ